MWHYEGFIGKAQLYFERAYEHPSADDGVQALWLLLGLEFLLRAPLAKVHASLLADPNGEAVMHAAGFPLKPGSAQPKSIQAKTVILRLGVVVPEFDKERQDEATFLSGLRNEELHSSESPLDVTHDIWLPHFTRVVDVICGHLGLDADEFVWPELMAEGRALVDKADKRLDHEISRRIATARDRCEHLKPEEAEARKISVSLPQDRWGLSGRGTTMAGGKPVQVVSCPACDTAIPMPLEAVRTTNERLEDDQIYRDVVYIATEFSCAVCDLKLTNTAEIRSAGIAQQYIRVEEESIEDRFLSNYEPDYGND